MMSIFVLSVRFFSSCIFVVSPLMFICSSSLQSYSPCMAYVLLDYFVDILIDISTLTVFCSL